MKKANKATDYTDEKQDTDTGFSLLDGWVFEGTCGESGNKNKHKRS